MDLQTQKVVIAGAGIGGLAAALALQAHGANVTVLEQSAEISEVGAGIQISPNGLRVIDALGLGAEFRAVAARGEATVLSDYRNPSEVLRMSLQASDGPGEFYYIHRADMIDLLSRAVRASGITIRLLQHVTGVSDTSRAGFQIANGTTIDGDILIGADGLHSPTRAHLNGVHQPFFTGQVAWRALVPIAAGSVPQEAHLQMGPGRHVVTYPLRHGTMLNIVAVQERAAWVAESWSHKDDPNHLREIFADFQGRAGKYLPKVEKTGLWGLFRHPVAPNWCRGNVAILGDAAHPTLPFMAQGAVMALEDAWVLADCLTRADTAQSGLMAYEKIRRPRAVQVVEAANGNAWKYHLSSTPVRMAAHMGLRMVNRVAPQRMLGQFDWIYRHDVTKP